jgi:hypothetical protein
VTLLFEDGTTAERTFSLAANSRTNVAVAVEFPESAGRRFTRGGRLGSRLIRPELRV